MTCEGTMDRYCLLLGVDAAQPSIDRLERLVRAQIIRVPFENVSKLYLGRTRAAKFIPTLEEHLDGIEGEWRQHDDGDQGAPALGIVGHFPPQQEADGDRRHRQDFQRQTPAALTGDVC
jgi:hypothetical protein